MPQPNDPVKRIEAALELGFPLSEAVNVVLGRSLASFARERGYRESEVSMCLRGYPGRVYGELRDDLADDLGIGRDELDRLIEGQGGIRPRDGVHGGRHGNDPAGRRDRRSSFDGDP